MPDFNTKLLYSLGFGLSWPFLPLIMLVGFFNGFIPAGMSLLVANTPPQRIGGALSLAQTGALVGQTMGPAVGAALTDRQHWLFWVSAGLMLTGGDVGV